MSYSKISNTVTRLGLAQNFQVNIVSQYRSRVGRVLDFYPKAIKNQHENYFINRF